MHAPDLADLCCNMLYQAMLLLFTAVHLLLPAARSRSLRQICVAICITCTHVHYPDFCIASACIYFTTNHMHFMHLPLLLLGPHGPEGGECNILIDLRVYSPLHVSLSSCSLHLHASASLYAHACSSIRICISGCTCLLMGHFISRVPPPNN